MKMKEKKVTNQGNKITEVAEREWQQQQSSWKQRGKVSYLDNLDNIDN
jgi:hypothetical protein